jgi:murein DD-endopeptidase MepM/ murein hydrolase activator NlpD
MAPAVRIIAVAMGAAGIVGATDTHLVGPEVPPVAAADASRSGEPPSPRDGRATAPRIASGRGELRVRPADALGIRPVPGPITSGFGPREGGMHTGVDIDAASGTPVAAANSGRVALAETYFGYGQTVIIKHPGTMKSLYGHLSSVRVKVGDRLHTADIVGLVGCTGTCTGDHLHFEVRTRGRPVDPRPYLPARFPQAPMIVVGAGHPPLAGAR